jgi:hypothetical protein
MATVCAQMIRANILAILRKLLIKLTKFGSRIMNKVQIPPDFAMPEHRALLAGDTALAAEFAEHVDRQLILWVSTPRRVLAEVRRQNNVEAVA